MAKVVPCDVPYDLLSIDPTKGRETSTDDDIAYLTKHLAYHKALFENYGFTYDGSFEESAIRLLTSLPG